MATKRWKKWLLWLLVLAPVCFAAVVYWRIVNQSAHDESRTAAVHRQFTKRGWTARPSSFTADWRQWSSPPAAPATIPTSVKAL
jgi:hypothetical protein